MLEIAILTVFPAAVAFAAAMDLFTMTIPNRVSLALVAGFLVLAPMAGFGFAAVASHMGAGLLMLAIGVLLFSAGLVGGGDAKLVAAVALWLGFENLFVYLFYVAFVGGGLALFFMSARKKPLPAFLCTEPWAVRLHDRRTGMPYGVALAAAALLIYPETTWFARAIG